jgi:hypothetical protein
MGSVEGDWQTFFGNARIVLDATSAAERSLRLWAGIGFNVFDWIQPNENSLSDIIRDLLDSQGSHGQGDSFLKLATEGLLPLPAGLLPGDLQKCKVVREARTHEGRRIDLMLDFGGTAIGIENKPFIGESQDQLTHYSRYLEDRFKGNFYMVFLHGSGMKSGSLEPKLRAKLEAEGRFRDVPYYSQSAPSLHNWLVKCAAHCQADKVRSFLMDFADYVSKTFRLYEESVA